MLKVFEQYQQDAVVYTQIELNWCPINYRDGPTEMARRLSIRTSRTSRS
jgi:hypothetical protein